MIPPRSRTWLLGSGVAFIFILLLVYGAKNHLEPSNRSQKSGPPDVKYLPTPTWTPPPIKEPFPALQTGAPPPVPAWNQPKEGLHEQYGIDFAPPLLIGFTRSWPILLQCVVSYVTAGWPAKDIYVVENTGVQRSNAEGKLSLQNPFYLDYRQLERLGVKVVRAPVLMSFAQMQNLFTYLAQEHGWRYYFWSHMDVLALSYEDGLDGEFPPAGEAGYKSLYERCLDVLGEAVRTDPRWANRFFAYDHLALVNREAYEDVGGWDPFIPYYMNDCDMHSRLLMRNWTQTDARAGLITDVNTVLEDLRALYRDASVEPRFVDPNPPPPKKSKKDWAKRSDAEYYAKLRKTADSMFHYKHGERGRNTWQLGQQGGQGEPYYYPARGLASAMEIMTEAGRTVFREKWGHRDCDLIPGTKLSAEDQWMVEKDY